MKSQGKIYLRARHYIPSLGRFLTRDTWGGNANSPMSFNRWTYGYGNPVNFTDPSGRFPQFCQYMPTKALYEGCVLAFNNLEPISYSSLGSQIKGERGCYYGLKNYRGPGYLEGVGGYEGFIGQIAGGVETVYDFATFERQTFWYAGGGFTDSS